jgi:hypothetical protein
MLFSIAISSAPSEHCILYQESFNGREDLTRPGQLALLSEVNTFINSLRKVEYERLFGEKMSKKRI